MPESSGKRSISHLRHVLLVAQVYYLYKDGVDPKNSPAVPYHFWHIAVAVPAAH